MTELELKEAYPKSAIDEKYYEVYDQLMQSPFVSPVQKGNLYRIWVKITADPEENLFEKPTEAGSTQAKIDQL